MSNFVTHAELAEAFAFNGLELPPTFGPVDPSNPSEAGSNDGPLEPGDSRWEQSNWATQGGNGTYLKNRAPDSSFTQPASKEEGLARVAAASETIQKVRDGLGLGKIPKDQSLAAAEEQLMVDTYPEVSLAWTDTNYARDVRGWI